MALVTVELRSIDETEAAVGWADNKTIVVDRPDGKAGGKGIGFNGGQLLALAIGGCFCNDLRYASHELGVQLTALAVSVSLELDGEPLVASAATVEVNCETADGSDPEPIIAHAKANCTVSNSVTSGFPVAFLRKR